MLHEEVDLKWEEIQAWVFDFQLLEKLRSDLIVGVSIPSLSNFKKTTMFSYGSFVTWTQFLSIFSIVVNYLQHKKSIKFTRGAKK